MEMSKYGFSLLWSEEDQGFIVTCPDFPGLSAFGETPEEALIEAKVALELFTDSLCASGHPLPKPTETVDYSGQIRLRMPKSLHSSLVKNAGEEGVSLNTWLVTLLAERNAASDLVNKICSKIDNVEKAIHLQAPKHKQIVIKNKTDYYQEFKQGEEYGNIKPVFN